MRSDGQAVMGWIWRMRRREKPLGGYLEASSSPLGSSIRASWTKSSLTEHHTRNFISDARTCITALCSDLGFVVLSPEKYLSSSSKCLLKKKKNDPRCLATYLIATTGGPSTLI